MNSIENLVTGDVILYSGKYPLHLRQQAVTGCSWAQVGLVLRLPESSLVYVFESTKLSECCDAIAGEIIHGVQISRLDHRIDTFNGRVGVRRIRPRLPKYLRHELYCFARDVHGYPFNDNKWTAGRAFRRRNTPDDGSSFFCSELVAEAFQRIGLLPVPPAGLTSNNYIPADFSSEYPNAQLRLCMGYRLTTERLLLPTLRAKPHKSLIGRVK